MSNLYGMSDLKSYKSRFVKIKNWHFNVNIKLNVFLHKVFKVTFLINLFAIMIGWLIMESINL